MPKARLLYYKRHELDDGSIVEGKIWELPARSGERPHGLKYSLAYVENRERVLGYDNERGKGDHRHWGQEEYSYAFTGIDQLLDDFFADIDRWRSRSQRS